jgi:hypothetical protein
MQKKPFNFWKTSDIKISTDSTGEMSVEHKYQGTLDDGTYHVSRAECRREAVKTLREMQAQEQAQEKECATSGSFTGGGWGFAN